MNYKKITTVIITAMLICSTKVQTTTAASTNKTRIYGQNRYETSIKVSEKGWQGSANAVICRGDNFADALCAVPLAKKYNAPILLISKDKVDKEIKDELKRLKVNNVFIIGGQGIINKNIEKEIKNITGINKTIRLGGKDRYETSKIIAEKVGCKGEIVLTSGTYSSDALSISSVAGIKGMPILLASKDKSNIREYLKINKVTKSFIIAGEVCVSKDIENILPNVERIYGKDRYDTNDKIIKRFSDIFNFKKVYMALAQSERGDEFADALTGAALAAKDGNPIVLVHKSIYKDTKDTIKHKLTKDSNIIALGGENIINKSLIDEMGNVEDKKVENTISKNESNTSNRSHHSHSSSSGSSTKPEVKPDVKPQIEKIEYNVTIQPTFPGAFTYNLQVNKANSSEKLKGYKLMYDGKVIAEDVDNDGIVRPLTIFFGEDTDKSKFKIIKDGQNIKFKGLK